MPCRFVAKPALLRFFTAAVLAAGVSSAFAGSRTYDFTTDPTTDPTILINGNNDQPWQSDTGNPGGFLALTYSQNDQNCAVLFPDIDNGALVKAFRFEADLRVGNSTGDRGADGFSVSFARSTDRYVADPTNVGGGFAGGGPAEFGTETGIAVSFDTWSGNALPDGADIEGIIVRVDNVTINRTSLPTRHGLCADDTSLQTGPRDAAYWSNGGDARLPEAWAGLCWQPFIIDLDETGKLTVTWKGRNILDKFQTTYFPSVSRLVLAGRTGNANEATHFDNIRLTTVQADQPLIGQPQGSSCEVVIPIADAGSNAANTNTIQVTFNGAAITPIINREAPNTYLTIALPSPVAAGSTNTFNVSFTSTTGANVAATRQFIAPASVTIPASAKASAFTATSSGFLVRTHWIGDENSRGPGDANTIENGETQLGGRFTDAAGTVLPNQADLSGATGGFLTAPIINFDQAAADVGAGENFNTTKPEADPRPNEAFPGMFPADSQNFAAEVLTFLELPAGCHTLGVNSDDGFLVTLGHGQYGTVLGSFNGGRGAADTTFRIVVAEAGVYPIRLSWWEGGGGANLEFFSVLPNGQKILINDRAVAGHIKAYSAGTAPGVLSDFGIQRANFGPNPGGDIIATFRNGGTTVDTASLVLTVDGVQVTPTIATAGSLVTATYSAPGAGFPLGTTHSARLVYTIGGVTATNNITFTIRVGGFFVEAEQFNFDGGQVIPAVNTMPYTGTEYDQLSAVHDTDYHQMTSVPDGDVYRINESPNTPFSRIVDAGTLDVQRGDFVVTDNYSIGWADTGDWFHYTRTFTNGNYYIFAAQSHGNPLGEADRQRVRFSIMGAGGAETFLGSYSRPSSGGWGNNTLNQVMNGPVPAVAALGGTQTIRATIGEGDFDWFVFVPTTNAPSTLNFVIEAEDFNHSGGQTVESASTMPLTTAPYNTMGATAEVDYHVIGDVTDAGSDFYRTNELPHVPINENNGINAGDRGLWIRQNNYKIGWIDNGEWFNYTRTFPEGNYNVWAAISHGGGAADRTSGSLQKVTSGATSTTQTTQDLGTFDAPGATGGWGNNRLVPLLSGGAPAVVPLNGTETIRYTAGSGDFDYLVFVKTAGAPPVGGPRITAVTRNGNQLTITWTGGGTLEESSTVGAGAAWTAVAGAGAGTATVTVGTGNRFFRIRS